MVAKIDTKVVCFCKKIRFPPEKKQKMAKQKSTPDQFLGGLALNPPEKMVGIDFF